MDAWTLRLLPPAETVYSRCWHRSEDPGCRKEGFQLVDFRTRRAGRSHIESLLYPSRVPGCIHFKHCHFRVQRDITHNGDCGGHNDSEPFRALDGAQEPKAI